MDNSAMKFYLISHIKQGLIRRFSIINHCLFAFRCATMRWCNVIFALIVKMLVKSKNYCFKLITIATLVDFYIAVFACIERISYLDAFIRLEKMTTRKTSLMRSVFKYGCCAKSEIRTLAPYGYG